jgi:hypothetical protein
MAARNLIPMFENSWGSPRETLRGGQRAKSIARTPTFPTAVRVPAELAVDAPYALPVGNPHLFVHEGARQALERRLTNAFPGPVILSITDNRHSIITHKLTNGVLRARVHHMFLDAPRGVVDALVRYVVRGEKAASDLVGDYIEANGPRLVKTPRSSHLVTQGAHHDLLRIFDELNARYFDGAVTTLITWGKKSPKREKARTSIKLGSYSAAEQLIRVNPVLDRVWVPRYLVTFVVYHEMLHHVIPAKSVNGRSVLHPPEFRDREKAFRHYERAMAWERAHLSRLLRT